MTRDEVVKRAHKLKALADRGEGGEARNAKEQLDILLKKNNVSIAELFGEDSYKWFYLTSLNESSTILQRVILSIRPDAKIEIEKKKSRITLKVLLSNGEGRKVDRKYKFFWRAYNEERQLLMSAFFNKHQNYFIPKQKKVDESFFKAGSETKAHPKTDIKTAPQSQVNTHNVADLKRISNMMMFLKNINFFDDDSAFDENRQLGK